MASIVRIKRSSVSGNPAVLAAGELAYSGLTDNGSNGGDRLYIGLGTETAGNAANHVVIGGKYFTDTVSAATSINTASTLVKRNASGDFTANNITATLLGNASTADALKNPPNIQGVLFDGTTSITVATAGTGVTISGTLISIGQSVATTANVNFNQVTAPTIIGSLTGNASTATKWATPRDITLTGDATATLSNVDGSAPATAALTLANVNSNVGTYGSASSVPVITVNAKGLITSVTTAATSSVLAITGTTGTDTVTLGVDTLTFAGGTGVTTTVTNNQVSIAIGQAVTPTSNVTFNDVTVSGTLYSNDITSTNINIDGDALIAGNLTVLGTTTTVNSTTVAIADKNISLAKDATNAAAADGGGITIYGPTVPATLLYTGGNDRWNLNKDLVVANTYGNLIGNASTSTKWVTARDLSLTGDATATLSSLDGSANVSANITLATVNSTVGSFGSATSVPVLTVNGKGLVTSASTLAIPTASTSVLGLAQFSSTQFTVVDGLVTMNAIDGGTF